VTEPGQLRTLIFPYHPDVTEREVANALDAMARVSLVHVLVLSEKHRRRILFRYFAYYHRSRTHLSLGKDAPDGRPIEQPELVGGDGRAGSGHVTSKNHPARTAEQAKRVQEPSSSWGAPGDSG
jgi:hypothetical protein